MENYFPEDVKIVVRGNISKVHPDKAAGMFTTQFNLTSTGTLHLCNLSLSDKMFSPRVLGK